MQVDKNLYQETINLLAYIQLMGSFDPLMDFAEIKKIVVSSYDFIKNNPESEINKKLPELKMTLGKIAKLYSDRFTPKKSIAEIASSFNDFFKNGVGIYDTGLEYGWLESQMDLRSLSLYPDLPYHYKIGIGPHKGNGGIEEDNLIKDAFNTLVKAKESLRTLDNYGNNLKKKEEETSYQFSEESYKLITELKYEVCAYSRLCIVAFYSFVECFVNSVGFNFLYRNEHSLSGKNKELLRGLKKGRYCRLDYKMEKFQIIIRADGQPIFITSDPSQVKFPFKDFFENYESLRNASVHYSPEKEKIWLRPHEWETIAQEFSKIAIKVALDFWKSCYPASNGPLYLGSLDYDLHRRLAEQRQERIMSIKKELEKS